MKISELPPLFKEWALENQKWYNKLHGRKDEDLNINLAFEWRDTPQGWQFWSIMNDYSLDSRYAINYLQENCILWR